MAARKSCTHMTWAEAKNKSGEGLGGKKKGEKPKKLTHMEKIIAKNTTGSGDQKQERSLRKQHQRQQEKLQVMAEKKAQDRQKLVEIPVIYPFEMAKEKRKEIATSIIEDATKLRETSIPTDVDLALLEAIAQNKEMQLAELLALEAIFADDTDYFRVCKASQLEALRTMMEDDYAMDPANELILRQVAYHPPIYMILCLDLEDMDSKLDATKYHAVSELVSTVMLRVTLPPYYPSQAESEEAIPSVEFLYEFSTDRQYQVKADKVMESLVLLDVDKLSQDLKMELKQILPDFGIYEVCVTWLTEHYHEYCDWNTLHPLLMDN